MGNLEGQIDRMTIDVGVLGYLHDGVWREDANVIQTLGGDRDGYLFDVLVRHFVLGKKDEYSLPPWLLHAPQRLHRGPLGPPPQISLHLRVQPAWLSARHLQSCNFSRLAPSLQTRGLHCRG